MKRVLGLMSLLTLMCSALSLVSVPAMAQKGGSGGSGGSGGGSGGGSTVVLTTVAIKMSSSANPANGAVPQGTATFTYTKNGLPQNLDIQVSNVDLPDGTVVTVQAVDALRVTGRCWHYEYFSYHMIITGGTGSLSFDASKGDVVPFLDPKKGYTQINVASNVSTLTTFLTSLLPFKGVL